MPPPMSSAASPALLRRVIEWVLAANIDLSQGAIIGHMLGIEAADQHPAGPLELGMCFELANTFPEWRPRIGELAALSPEWAALVRQWQEVEKEEERITFGYMESALTFNQHGEYLDRLYRRVWPALSLEFRARKQARRNAKMDMDRIPTPEDIYSDPAASAWLKSALRTAIGRDPVDAANDAEVLAAVLSRQADVAAAFSLKAAG